MVQNWRGRYAAALNECDMLWRVMIEPARGWRVPMFVVQAAPIMRTLLILFPFLLCTLVSAQPVDPPTYWPQPIKPAIVHRPIRSGKPVPDTYFVTDTIVVTITGHVKLDGSCSGGTPLYGFQRKEGDAWTDYLPPCNVQLCCGMPSADWMQHTVALIPGHVAMPGRGRPWKPGEYRAVILLAGDQELVGSAFTVVAP